MTSGLANMKMVSLFSGIGGLDLGFIKSGCKLVWANDDDKYAVREYRENVSRNIVYGDINRVLSKIPECDLLIGGFPCQPFSLMGYQKGFKDKRGTLFFTIEKILKMNKPEIVVLENVKNLKTHNNGKTFKRMKVILHRIGYYVRSEVLNTCDFGLPQIRRRLFIVCFSKSRFNEADVKFRFKYPKPIKLRKSVQDILDRNVGKKYFLSEKIKPTILSGGSGNYHSRWSINNKVAKPLTSTMFKMHRANQDNYYTDHRNRSRFHDTANRRISCIRRLTPNECRKLQGFPANWKYVVSDTQLYRQFGNAVSVNVSYRVAQSINRFLEEIHNE